MNEKILEEKPPRRSRPEMILVILELLETPHLKTHIFYKCNLNHVTLKKILPELEEKQLVHKFQTRYKVRKTIFTMYQTTSKGREVALHYRKIKELVK